MAKRSKTIDMTLYTLCVDGAAIVTCALENTELKKDERRAIGDAFVELWRLGGGDPMQLEDRSMLARVPTEEESEAWHAIVTSRRSCFMAGQLKPAFIRGATVAPSGRWLHIGGVHH